MQIPRWAAVAVLAPIGFLLLHSSIVSHSSLAERVRDTAPISSTNISTPAVTSETISSRPVTPVHAPSTMVVATADQATADAAIDRPPPAPSAALSLVLSNEWAKGKFEHFSPAELHQLAERCELRWRLPPFSGGQSPAFADDEERAIYGDVLASEEARYKSAMSALHHELTGDDGPSDLRSLRDSLRMNPDADPRDVHRALSAQRAGATQSAPRGIYASFLREELDASDTFEQALAAQLGPERAQALRDGAGSRHTLTGCDDDSAMYRSER